MDGAGRKDLCGEHRQSVPEAEEVQAFKSSYFFRYITICHLIVPRDDEGEAKQGNKAALCAV